MRQVLFCITLLVVVLTSCRKSAQVEKEQGVKIKIMTRDLMFSGEIDKSKAFSQTSGGKLRALLPYKAGDSKSTFRYKIIEYSNEGVRLNTGFIVALEPIDKSYDLFKINIKHEGKPLVVRGGTKDNTPRGEKIRARIKSNDVHSVELGEVLSLYANCQDMPRVCVDWYWVTYNPYTGNVESEFFLYTSCYDPCSFNSGGAGGTGEGSCQDAAEDLESGPTAAEIGAQSLGESGNERTFSYSWMFHKHFLGLWNYKSLEVGVHKKQPDNSWKWKSLTHSSVARSGFVAGGSLECVVNSAVPQVGIYNAGMQLNYTVTATAVCKGFPISVSNTYNNSSPIWHVSYRGPFQ